MPVAFTLPESNGPAIQDTAGHVWRYIEDQPPGPRNTDRCANQLCYWYWDDTETQTRWVITSALPCRHQNRSFEVAIDMVVHGVIYHQPRDAEAPIQVAAQAVRPYPNGYPNSQFFQIPKTEWVRALEALGWEPPVINPTPAELRRLEEVGNSIILLWETERQMQRMERALRFPERSSNYRYWRKRYGRMIEHLDQMGVTEEIRKEALQILRDDQLDYGESAERMSHIRKKKATCVLIGEWLEHRLTRRKRQQKIPDGAEELLGW